MQTISALLRLLLLLTVPSCQILTNAFALFPSKVVVSSNTAKRSLACQSRECTVLSSTSWRDDDAFMDDDAFDVEAMRKRLESMVSSSGEVSPCRESKATKGSLLPTPSQSFTSPPLKQVFLDVESTGGIGDVVIPSPPPMTAIARERKRAEIELLRAVEHGDESLSDLWDLWFNERGSNAAAKLHEADELTGYGPAGWERAESILIELIEEYGIHWSEPTNRLATLYYIKGNLKASEAACKAVLAVKPWHFGALSGLVMVYAGLNDAENARFWAARRLPTYAPVGPNRRREQWALNAVEHASEQLRKADEHLHESFGNIDEHITDVEERMALIKVDEDECWQ